MHSGKGKVFMITGASAGIGRALAVEAGRRGARVALLARRRNLLEEVKEIITGDGGEAVVIQSDLRNPESLAEAFGIVDSQLGRLDVLINNAGVLEPIAPILQIPDEELLNSINTNVLAVYIATREALKRMLDQDSGGTILSVTSGAAIRPYIGWSIYGSQKAAVDMFTKVVAKEIENTPVRIAAISPGPVETYMQETIRNTSIECFPAREKFVKMHNEGQLPGPEDVAGSFIDISLTDWPELSGIIDDIRSPDFRNICCRYGVTFK